MSSPTLKRLPTIPSPLSGDDCRLLVESVTDYAIFMLDVGGTITTWNIGAERMKGYRAHEIIGAHFSTFYPPEDVASGKPERALATAREFGRVEDEGWRVRSDGARFWANVIITALRDESGTLRGFGKVTRDLSRRRANDEQLRRSEERFQHLVEAATEYAIFMLDAAGHVATWNAGARKAKGYEAAEIIGSHFSAFYTPEDRAAGMPARMLETVRRDGRVEAEGWRLRKGGTRFWANVVITALRDDKGDIRGFVKVTRDLTERREAEETERRLLVEQAARSAAEQSERRLRESEDAARRAAERAEAAARQAEEANRVKDEFLATVSHELRTPLSAITGWAAMLRDRVTDPSLLKGIDVIYRNAQTQARIIDDILDVSRIITGKLRLELKPTSLITVVREAVEVVRPSATAKKLTLELVSTSELAVVLGDSERLRQVIWNLLSNAVKFTDPGGIVVITVEQDASNVRVSVRDTGRGIEPQFLPFVFDRFQQADSSTTRRVGGLGLGLAIVRHIVELHGGHVHVESRGRGQGALFRVSLPLRPTVEEVDPRGAPPDVVAPPPRPSLRPRQPSSLDGLRVLVVDDEPDTSEMLHHVLTEAGALVETAPSAAAGLEAVRRFRPHVLVSDIGMPDEDGYSFIRRVRALELGAEGSIPSIALTAYTRSEDRTRALAAGFTTHVGKPVNFDDLVAALANLGAFARR